MLVVVAHARVGRPAAANAGLWIHLCLVTRWATGGTTAATAVSYATSKTAVQYISPSEDELDAEREAAKAPEAPKETKATKETRQAGTGSGRNS